MRKNMRKLRHFTKNHMKWLKIFGAGNGIRTRDFNLGKVEKYYYIKCLNKIIKSVKTMN